MPPGITEDLYSGLKLSVNYYRGNLDMLLELYRRFGPVFTNRMMGLKIVWLIGAEANQRMYVDDWEDFYWWGQSLEGHLAGLIGEGLLSSVDETHDKARKLLDPVFSKSNLKLYVKTMIELTEQQVNDLENGQRFDFYEWVYDLALLNATACFMGMDPDRIDTHSLHENFDTCVQYYQNPIFLQALRGPGTPYRAFQNAKRKIDEFLYEEIDNRRSNPSEHGDNILDRLIQAEEDGQTFTDEEIHDQIMTLYWAGHDTTISAISWMVMLVGRHPTVYDRLKAELQERVGDQPVDPEEVIDGLPYMEMVMDEALRLYPPAWVAFRKARKDFEIHGHTIPKGTDVAFSSYATHRLPHLFDNPTAFDPERMKPENKRDFPPGAYIPFARGPRTCIGMNFAKYEIKLVMATLLRHFDFELVPGQEFNTQPVATLTPDGVRIQVSDPDGESINTGPDSIPSVSNEDTDESGESQCPVH